MATNPVPAPSSSTSFPCRSTWCLLLSRKEHRASACRTSRRQTLGSHHRVQLGRRVLPATHSWPHDSSEVVDGLVNDDVVAGVVVGVFPKAAPRAGRPGRLSALLHSGGWKSRLFWEEISGPIRAGGIFPSTQKQEVGCRCGDGGARTGCGCGTVRNLK